MEALWPRLSALKEELDGDVQRLITAVWDEYFSTNKWPSTWTFNSRFGGRTRVRELCAKLGGILYEGGHGGDHGEYALTLMGALLVGDSLLKQKHLLGYIGMCASAAISAHRRICTSLDLKRTPSPIQVSSGQGA